MTESQKLKHCVGCRDNYYNSVGNSTNGRCWMLSDMKMVWKKEVSVDQRPPWDQKAKRLPNCFHRPRYVYVRPNQTY